MLLTLLTMLLTLRQLCSPIAIDPAVDPLRRLTLWTIPLRRRLETNQTTTGSCTAPNRIILATDCDAVESNRGRYEVRQQRPLQAESLPPRDFITARQGPPRDPKE